MKREISKKEIVKLIGATDYTPIILDIGCYDGFDSADLANSLKSCQVHCFECDPRSIELFKHEQANNKQLFLQPYAVCNVDGTVSLTLSDSNTRRHYEFQDSWSASSSIKKPKGHLELFEDVFFYEAPLDVMATKLDTWHAKNLPGKRIDFIWCDVNGAEEDVVIGGLRTLMQYTRYLYIEFSDKELYEGQVSKNKLLSLFPDYFSEQKIYNFRGNFGNVLLKNEALN